MPIKINLDKQGRIEVDLLSIDIKHATVTFRDETDGVGTAPLLETPNQIPNTGQLKAAIEAVLGDIE